MSLQSVVRRELEACEEKCSRHFRLYWDHSMPLHLHHFYFYMGRRRYLIKELIKAQLKEFARD
jgi:hypothetical protein